MVSEFLGIFRRNHLFKNVRLALAGAIIGYIFVPYFPIKFLCLTLALWALGQMDISHRNGMLILASAFYTFAFIFTPFACYLFTTPQLLSLPNILWTEAVIVLLGCLWLYWVVRQTDIFMRCEMPAFLLFACYSILFTLIYHPSWIADLAYAGDEVFHIFSIHVLDVFVYQTYFPGWAFIFSLWFIVAFFYLAIKKYEKTEFSWICSVVLLIISGCFILFLYWHKPDAVKEIVEHPFFKGRIIRYPIAEAWISSLMVMGCYDYWNGSVIPIEICRFLPALSLWGIGLILCADTRWKHVPFLFRVLAALAIVTIPDLFFHGTIVYLELPAIFLLCVVLLDAKNILMGNSDVVWKRTSWWALVFSGFTKETAIPVVLLILTSRLVFQIYSCLAQKKQRIPFLKEECGLWFAALMPFSLYFLFCQYIMAVYGLEPARVYGNQFSQIVNITLWTESLWNLRYQFGGILILAIYGIWSLWKKKDRATLALSLVTFIGMKAFYICDSDLWLSLARYNLLLLPPVIVLGWEGLTHLAENRERWAKIVILLLLTLNIMLRPFNFQGDRIAWGNSGERWYPFYKCFSDLQKSQKNSLSLKILIGNMPFPYGISIVTDSLGWSPSVTQHPPPSPSLSEIANFEETLQYACNHKFDVVVYRNEKDIKIGTGYSLHGFVKVREYEGAVGSLIVLYKSSLLDRRK